MFRIGVSEVILLLSFAVLIGLLVVAFRLVTRPRDRLDASELPVLLKVADSSGGHPACPTCKSLSFHPVGPRSRPIFLLVLGSLAFGTSPEGVQPGLIACTVCGRRYRQG